MCDQAHDADQQTRLRRVAALVARGASLNQVFGAAANEASRLVGEQVTLTRFEDDGVYSVVAVAEGAPVPLGTRVNYDPGCIADRVQRTGGPARIDDYAEVAIGPAGPPAEVRAELRGDALILEISDDGRGGADERGGSGLTGLGDRVDAARGTLAVTSPPGEGTTIRASLPMTLATAAPALI